MKPSDRGKRFQVVLFDLGDTLIYFEGDFVSTFELAKQKLVDSLRASGVEIGSGFLAEFSSQLDDYFQGREVEMVELTTRRVLEKVLRERGYPEMPDRILRKALADMYAVTQEHWLPETDALPTLERLKQLGYRMALVSNAADDENTQTLVDKLGARQYLDAVLVSAAVGDRKPNPSIFQVALEQLAVSPDQAVMVGDNLAADIAGARNAGIFSIWITRHAVTPANRANLKTISPDATIRTLSELPDLLETLS